MSNGFVKKDTIQVDRTTANSLHWENNRTLELVVRNLAAAGFTEEDISGFIGVRLSNLQKRLNHIPSLKAALMEGKDEATQMMVAQMYRRAMGGNVHQKIIEKIKANGKKETMIITEESRPDAKLMMFWLSNQDPANWKLSGAIEKERKKQVLNNEEQPESDKIARLSRDVFKGHSDGLERKHRVQETASHAVADGAGDATDLHCDVPGETADNLQDDALDVSAEAGTELVQASSVHDMGSAG